MSGPYAVSHVLSPAEIVARLGGTDVSLKTLTALNAATQDAVRIAGNGLGTSSRVATITTAALGDNRTYTFPDASGNVALDSVANVWTALNTFRKTTGGAESSFRTQTNTDSYATQWAIGQGPNILDCAFRYFNGTSWVFVGQFFGSGAFALGTPALLGTERFRSAGGGSILATVVGATDVLVSDGVVKAGRALWTAANGELALNNGAIVFPSDASGVLRQGFQTAGTNAYAMTLAGASSGTSVLGTGIAGDNFRRFRILVTGEMLAGDGTSAAASCIKPETSTTAEDCRLLLWDVTAGFLKRVTRGAADSGGTGFRLLRIEN
jgi:hypothetical protein